MTYGAIVPATTHDPRALSQKDLSVIFDHHEAFDVRDTENGATWKECRACGTRWPCDAHQLQMHIRAQEREIDELKGDLEAMEYEG